MTVFYGGENMRNAIRPQWLLPLAILALHAPIINDWVLVDGRLNLAFQKCDRRRSGTCSPQISPFKSLNLFERYGFQPFESCERRKLQFDVLLLIGCCSSYPCTC